MHRSGGGTTGAFGSKGVRRRRWRFHLSTNVHRGDTYAPKKKGKRRKRTRTPPPCTPHHTTPPHPPASLDRLAGALFSRHRERQKNEHISLMRSSNQRDEELAESKLRRAALSKALRNGERQQQQQQLSALRAWVRRPRARTLDTNLKPTPLMNEQHTQCGRRVRARNLYNVSTYKHARFERPPHPSIYPRTASTAAKLSTANLAGKGKGDDQRFRTKILQQQGGLGGGGTGERGDRRVNPGH